MEDILTQISREATSVKHAAVKKACREALDLLEDSTVSAAAEAYQLRERCLYPLQLALETKQNKLTTLAIGGIQRMLTDDRFQSSIEAEQEERWLPMQILATVAPTPTLPEETQVEVMKVLLNMTFSTAWCMNAGVITKITELCFSTFLSTTKSGLRNAVVQTLVRILSVFYQRQTLHNDALAQQVVLDTFASTSQGSVRTAIKATMTQLLTAIAEKLADKMALPMEDADSAIAEFTSKGETLGEAESLTNDVVAILKYLCKKLFTAQSAPASQAHQTEPLLLEGIHAILCNIPTSMRNNQQFLDLIWQELCPSLISILGNPLTDRSVTSQQRAPGQEEVGRGSGCSSVAPSTNAPSAKIIYYISVELVRLVGSLQSMRPVLESLFHRMLHYPPPVHRLVALKALREVLSNPERLLDLAGPTVADSSCKPSSTPGGSNKRRSSNNDMALLKLIVDSIQECCQCNDSMVCITSIELINSLLTSAEKLVQGQALTEEKVSEMLSWYKEGEEFSSRLSICSEPPKSEPSTPLSPMVSPSATKQNGVYINDDDTDTDSDTASFTGPPQVQKLHDREEIERQYKAKSQQSTRLGFAQIERQSAQNYIQSLREVLPSLLQSSSVLEVDESLQLFASNVCTAQCEQGSSGSEPTAILNADGVYLATYSALLLNLKLMYTGYYHSEEKSLPMSEDQFIDEVLSTGLLLYLSPTWLSEVFQQVIRTNLLEDAGHKVDSQEAWDMPLIQLLVDLDGLESRKMNGQLLSDFRDTDGIDVIGGKDPLENTSWAVEAGMKFVRRMLTVCWDGILDVLSVLVNGSSTCGITSSFAVMFNAKEESLKARDAICTSLNGLQLAARLSCVLGLQDRCGAVFQQLANASCIIEDFRQQRPLEKKGGGLPLVLPIKPKLARLHAAHALSMDVVLSIGLEMGSHAADCWRHVFSCCAHILELEHTYFSTGHNQSSLPKVQQEQQQQQLDLSGGDSFNMSDEAEYFSNVMVPVEPVAPSINVPELIQQSRLESGWDSTVAGGGVLTESQASKVLCGLSVEVDRLFEEAANKLNLKALVSFLQELCASSQQQLSEYGRHHQDGTTSAHPVTALHLYRLGDIMMRCLRSGRPLLHTMRAWSVVAPHFVEAACHKDRNVSKKAVTCIHEAVTTLLSSQPELPHFHFNESLCKPFENLLCLSLCDGDVQDQIVCSICEMVEACTNEIKSGWRSLFGALRAVKIEYTTNEEVNEARQRHVAAVLDVFDVFLDTDNILVFANAAVDCILCLLKYVRGPGEFEGIEEDDSDSGSEVSEPATENLCLPALKYLKQCCGILASMCEMPACPVFNGAHRIRTEACPKTVDPVIPNMDLQAFQKSFHHSDPRPESPTSTVAPSRGQDGDSSPDIKSTDSGIGVVTDTQKDGKNVDHTEKESPLDDSGVGEDRHGAILSPSRHQRQKCEVNYVARSLEEFDKHTGVLHVWFLVLEGLAGTVSACPKNYQPQTLEMLFDLLRSSAQVPGPEFSLYCVNHLLLPTMQSWLRRGNQLTGYWDTNTTANFKQCAGMCTDLVVEFTVEFSKLPLDGSSEGDGTCDHMAGVEFMLKQLLDVLTECVAQPVESLSRLGCACIRHCLLSSGPMLTETMWHVVSQSMLHAIDVSLYCLRQLMTPFQANSDNFYGDVGSVKVAVRKDCSGIECERLRLLAQQVFLLDSQRGTSSVIDYEVEEDRSYIFLIYPPNKQSTEDAQDQPLTRVSFRSIVVGLLSHQLLVQTVGILLLQGSDNTVPAEQQMMPILASRGSQRNGTEEGQDADLIEDTPLPGMMRYLSSRNMLSLLQCLYNSYQTASMLDARPGLKFLFQKVARAEVAANLYKQAGISLTFYMHALLEICCHQDNICMDSTKRVLGEITRTPDGPNKGTGLITTEQMDGVDNELAAALTSDDSLQKHIGVFVRKLKAVFDEVSTDYIDMYLEKEGPSKADRLSTQLLVFLTAQPEEITTLKRDKSIREMVAERLHTQQQQQQELMSAAEGTMSLQAVAVQGEESSDPLADTGLQPVDLVPTPLDETKSKREQDDKVYTVATDRTIKSLMTEYKKRKQAHSMPTFVKAQRSKATPPKAQKAPPTSAMDRQVEEQQKASIMKDSEAHLNSWIELICNILQLLQQVPDYQYTALLPVVFSAFNQLMCHCKDKRLRQALAQWTHRVGHIYGFTPPGATEPPVAKH